MFSASCVLLRRKLFTGAGTASAAITRRKRRICISNVMAKRHYSKSPPTSIDDEAEINALLNDDKATTKKAFNTKITSNELVRSTAPPHRERTVTIPLSNRPIFPGFYKTITINDARVSAILSKILKSSNPYISLFLKKDSSLLEGDKINSIEEIHRIGVFAKIVNIIPSNIEGDDSCTLIVYPFNRIVVKKVLSSLDSPCTVCLTEKVSIEGQSSEDGQAKSQMTKALTQEVLTTLSEVSKMNPFFREHIATTNVTSQIFEDPGKLADFVAVLCNGDDSEEIQSLLEEISDIEERLRKALVLLKKELVTSRLQQSISKDVEKRLSQRQREYFLHEQLKTIKRELGLESDPKEKIVQTLVERLKGKTMPPSVKRVWDEEIAKLAVLEPSGAEFNVTRNYLDWLSFMPFGIGSKENFDLEKAKAILDRDHYGLTDVKDRILEFIAVSSRRFGGDNNIVDDNDNDKNAKNAKEDKNTTKGISKGAGKIICLAGPPGVGKTSIGKSIASSLNREYYRFSVGGLSDVSEIKGHRRTYVGAMPGKVVQALKRVQTENPLILIDEIDKLGRSGTQGDPASALLELLDPEQNHSFMDHYLDVPLDLSKVLFVCTANQLDTIPPPLLDRMEIINLSGYVQEEKVEIAKKYLIPQALSNCGLKEGEVFIGDSLINLLIRSYCRESGVRSLKKMIEKMLRKITLRLVKGEIGAVNGGGVNSSTETLSDPKQNPLKHTPFIPTEEDVKKFLGVPPFTSDRLFKEKVLPAGVVTGLAWTSMGGSILYIESILQRPIKKESDGASLTSSSLSSSSSSSPKPSLMITGQLGDVMKESSTIAYSYAKSFMAKKYPENDFFEQAQIHMHVPEGATPKDGPSAGCAMVTALLSKALDKDLSAEMAMTGEITLTGKVLRIGGLREKAIAARRSGIRKIIIPMDNEADWNELPSHIRDGLEVAFVSDYEDISKALLF